MTAYDRRQLLDKATFLDFTVETVRCIQAAFVMLPRRWVVERTFGRMARYRHLIRDYEARMDVSHAMINIAMVAVGTRLGMPIRMHSNAGVLL